MHTLIGECTHILMNTFTGYSLSVTHKINVFILCFSIVRLERLGGNLTNDRRLAACGQISEGLRQFRNDPPHRPLAQMGNLSSFEREGNDTFLSLRTASFVYIIRDGLSFVCGPVQ
jgi:hypothetical protein